jgi:hypothetical protein
MDSNQPGALDRERSYHAIRNATAAIVVPRPGTVETAIFLLSEAKGSLEHSVAESASVETKATSLLGIVAGACGTICGGSHGMMRARCSSLTPRLLRRRSHCFSTPEP